MQEIISGFRISPQQKQLWDLQRHCNVGASVCAVSINGPLDVTHLREAFDRLVEQHGALRTSFQQVPGMDIPVQVIADEGTLQWRFHDLSSLDEDRRSSQIDELLGEERESLADTATALGASLLRLAPDEHLLIFTLKALCGDLGTLNRLVSEVSLIYSQSSLSDAPLQYAEFAEWQNDLFVEDEAPQGKEFWKQTARLGWPEVVLPFRREHAGAERIEVATLEWPVPEVVAKKVQQVAARQGVALPEFLLACWQTLLWRLGDQPEFVIGFGLDPREYYEDLRSTLGLFVKWLPLPCRFNAGGRFRDVVQRVSQSVEDAREWQDYFLREEYDAAANGNHQRFGFAAGYEFIERPEPLSSAGVTFTIVHQYSRTEQFGLKLNTGRSGELLSAQFQYPKNIYASEDIERLADQFLTLLESATDDWETPVSRLNILSNKERRRLLVEFNETDAAYLAGICIHQLFEQQVDRTPNSPALLYEGEELTYAELDARANQLAHYLRALGTGPEQIVALHLERSIEVIVAMLGILKAGAAYLPLDPQHPQQHRDYILSDARVLCVLSTTSMGTPVRQHDVRYVYLDADAKEIERQSRERPENVTLPENACYVLYTSGSTGKPKGVLITHRALNNHMHLMEREFPLEPSDRVVQKTSFSFDASVWEIYAPLLAGAQLIVAPPGAHEDPAALIKLMREERITILKLVPSLLRALLEEGLSACESLRCVFCGGEALSFELQQSFLSQVNAKLYNCYGPTEATIDTSVWACQPGAGEHGVLIGPPAANTTYYILDRELQPVPVWVSGRLFIGGDALARCYLNEPRLTADRFVPDPFATSAGKRLFDTKDLARFWPNGVVEYLGRADYQVKLRGFRISLVEIETTLSGHPLVRDCAVIVREDELNEQQLVSYVVASQSNALSNLTDNDFHTLPGDLPVAFLNKSETDLLYTEIFENTCYLRHGLNLNDGDCVFDIGANTGLFTLFVHQYCANARVYAFEPLPPIYEKLQLNNDLYGLNAKLFQFGLSNKAITAEFTYYPHVSAMSGRYADVAIDQKATSTFLSNYAAQSIDQTDDLLAGRFETQKYQCRLKTLSQVIEEQNIERIDLLKIDVERSELDVLEGIAEDDWPKIRQIVLEVDDSDGRLDGIVTLLTEYGYEFEIEQNQLLRSTGLHKIFARRQSEAVSTRSRTKATLTPRRLSTAQLRTFLLEQLPAYMVPSVFVMLPELPLMQNGKVDRKALPAPEQNVSNAAEYVAPRTPEEETLARIWCEVLRRDRISVHENFFELGGHSLLAMQIVSRTRKAFQLELPLRVIFESQTIAELAEQVANTRLEHAASAPPGIVPVSRDEELSLSFAQRRLWFLEQLAPDSPFYNVPAALRLTGSLDTGALEQTLNEIVRRHEALRTVFPTRDGKPFQFINPPYQLTLEPLDLSELPDQEREAEARRLVDEEGRSAPPAKAASTCDVGV
jgi:amino acid adenylation domain-containing protein/FkbM family methyltransferase